MKILMMRWSLLCALGFVSVTHGGTTNPSVLTNAGGTEQWYSIDHFVSQSKAQLISAGVTFPFDRATARAWVCPAGQEFVLVVFDQGLGKLACSVWLGRNGKIIRHVIAPTKA